MAKRPQPHDAYKEKFRPDADAALDAEIEAALSGLSEDELYGDKAQPANREAAAPPHTAGDKQIRRGRVARIDKDDIFVDFGGKSQGLISRQQFLGADEPTFGQEMDFIVDKYDAREGLLLLSRRGATAQNVSW